MLHVLASDVQWLYFLLRPHQHCIEQHSRSLHDYSIASEDVICASTRDFLEEQVKVDGHQRL